MQSGGVWEDLSFCIMACQSVRPRISSWFVVCPAQTIAVNLVGSSVVRRLLSAGCCREVSRKKCGIDLPSCLVVDRSKGFVHPWTEGADTHYRLAASTRLL